MKQQTISKSDSDRTAAKTKQAYAMSGEQIPVGPWSVVHRTRLPHKPGLPLSSGGCGDAIER